MEHKKDIGALLKARLDAAEKAPKQTLWERLDNSLEEREKKRRRAAWFWYGGAGILLALLILAGIFTGSNFSEINDNATKVSTEAKPGETNINETNTIETSTSETEDTDKNTIEILRKPTSEDLTNGNPDKQYGTETGLKTTPTGETSESLKTNNTSTATKQSKTTRKNTTSSGKDPMTEAGFTVTTTHEYYNSDLDTTTTSRSKQKIDSLVAANKRKMAIVDSIARKRATDSIKLNEARKDSIPQ